MLFPGALRTRSLPLYNAVGWIWDHNARSINLKELLLEVVPITSRRRTFRYEGPTYSRQQVAITGVRCETDGMKGERSAQRDLA